jgi:arylsulfatase A
MRTNSSADSFNRNEIMVPKVLKTAGYVAAQVGKWNLPREPDEWGFDEYLHFQGSGKYWSDQAKTYTQNNETIELGERYLPDVMHEFLVDFLKRHKAEPFYVHYALSQLHAPIVRTPDSRPGNTDLYADNVAYVDKLMGQLVDALERLGLREKTLLVFVGDNGTAPTFASQATVHGRAISGAKGSLLEGGSRVPLIVNWPGTTPAGRVLEDLTDFSDFLPTFAELGGAKLPDAKIDGHSLAAQIKGHPGRPRDWIYMQLGEKRYVRDARWKLTGEGKLFDLKEAPFQELAVSADTTDPDAKAGREKLHAVLSDLQSQDPGPPTPRQDEKRKKAVQ